MKKIMSCILLSFFLGFSPSFASLKYFKKANFIYSTKKNIKYKNLKIAYFLIRSGMYYSAAYFLKKSLMTEKLSNIKRRDKYIRIVSRSIGHEIFNNLSFAALKKSKSSSLLFILAVKYFKKKKYKYSLHYLFKISKKSIFYIDSVHLKAMNYNKLNKFSLAIAKFKQCKFLAQDVSETQKDYILKKKYQFLSETCEAAIPRIYFKMGKYKKASQFYKKIQPVSYLWPNIIQEDAWTSYILKDYNYSIGRLLTYKFPLLENYIFPEVEYLSAVNYYKLCLYKESAETITFFQNHYVKSGKKLNYFLKKFKNDRTIFLKLAINKNDMNFADFKLLKRLVRYVRRRPKFLIKKRSVGYINYEKRLLEQVAENTLKNNLQVYLSKVKKNISYRFNYFIKQHLYRVANDINKYSEKMAYLHLDVLSKKKTNVFSKKINKNDDILSKIARGKKQYFWNFKKEFWIDELGNYVFYLKSRCK